MTQSRFTYPVQPDDLAYWNFVFKVAQHQDSFLISYSNTANDSLDDKASHRVAIQITKFATSTIQILAAENQPPLELPFFLLKTLVDYAKQLKEATLKRNSC